MKTAKEIAQWVIDNRYPKNEIDKMDSVEMYHLLVQKIDEYANQSKWIPVSERYPENMQSILVTNGKVIVAGGFYEGADTFCANSFESNAIVCVDIEKFTHWMPLPEMPIQSTQKPE